jgi:hypothetical protein
MSAFDDFVLISAFSFRESGERFCKRLGVPPSEWRRIAKMKHDQYTFKPLVKKADGNYFREFEDKPRRDDAQN